MSTFYVTPTNTDFLNPIYFDNLTGKWTIPIISFDAHRINPYFGEIDPLNEDKAYQQSVIDNFYMRLKEKWLYHKSIFRKLLKYFRVEKKDGSGHISIVPRMTDVSENNISKEDRRHAFRYIEKVFLSRKFVAKVLRQYVAVARIKWYDLFYDVENVRELFAHKLKKLILSTIYKLEDKKDNTVIMQSKK